MEVDNSTPQIPVFVAATYTDLIEHRKVIREALEAMNVDVHGMGEVSSLDACLTDMEECRIFVGIFAMRYGTLPEGEEKSFIHHEYDEAQRLGLPVLVYLWDEDHPISFKNVDMGDKGQKLAQLKEVLKNRHTVDYFTTPEDLKEKILNDIASPLKKEHEKEYERIRKEKVREYERRRKHAQEELDKAEREWEESAKTLRDAEEEYRTATENEARTKQRLEQTKKKLLETLELGREDMMGQQPSAVISQAVLTPVPAALAATPPPAPLPQAPTTAPAALQQPVAAARAAPHAGAKATKATKAAKAAEAAEAAATALEAAAPLSAPVAVRALPTKPGDTFRDGRHMPLMVVVPPGEFEMGSPETEEDRNDGEGPVHQVRIRYTFAVGVYAVTFDEWDTCVDDGGCNGYDPNDQGWGRGKRPVVNVSWNDAQLYLQWLNEKSGRTYRILSEAEWEYVARAGSSTPFYFGDTITTSQANFNGNDTYGGSTTGIYREQTTVSGRFGCNGFGLYDVHGNIWEWVQDCWNRNYRGAPRDGAPRLDGECSRRAVRGGSWSNDPIFLRCASRFRFSIDSRNPRVGFRIAMSL